MLKTEHEKKISKLEKGIESLKNDVLKFKTQYDEAQSSKETLQKNLDDMTQQANRMRKMRDDDAICYAQTLTKLKDLGEEISEVLKLFP